MSQQPLDYQVPMQHQSTHPGRVVAASIATAANVILAAAAIWWHCVTWSEFRHTGGGWFGPIVFMCGAAILLAAQLVFGVLPSSIVARQGTSLAAVNRRRLIVSAWCGVLVNVLGFAFVFIYFLVVPMAHQAPG
jgi:hypothetical protein